MKIEMREEEGVVVLAPVGKMLIGEGDMMFREIVEQCWRDGKIRFVVDMRQTPFVDAASLGEIVREYTGTKRRGGNIVFLVPTSPSGHRFRDLLQITGLKGVLELFEYEAPALKAASGLWAREDS